MRDVWLYIPHPVDHPGWFFWLFFLGSSSVAAFIDEEAAYAIFGTGLQFGLFVRVLNALFRLDRWLFNLRVALRELFVPRQPH